jgi:hypothetical protein
MDRSRRFPASVHLFLFVLPAALGGCAKNVWITQYPAFYTPDLRSIVVVPFRNTTGDPLAGRIISEKVTAALAANGTYQVHSHADLPLLAGEAAIEPAGGEAQALAKLLRNRGRVQAILTGTVSDYTVTQHREWRERPVYRRDKRGRRYLSHHEAYTHIRSEATVDAVARLIRVSDGATIHASAPGAARSKVTSEAPPDGSQPPQRTARECLAAAGDQCAAKLLEEFAVVSRQVRVGRDAFRTAHRLDGTKWKGGKKFSLTDKQLLVVVKLPPECDRNHFRIVIWRKDTGAELAAAELTWQRQWSGEVGTAFAFTPADIAAKGGGPGKYAAGLYCAHEPVLTTDFQIEAEK